MTLSTPKINVSPDATRNSSIPMMSAVLSWVMRQGAAAMHAANASNFTRAFPR
jgi:hypothetical protein